MCGRCIQCGKDILVTNSRKYPKVFCSYGCYEKWSKYNREPNCTCAICGKPIYIKPSRLNKNKVGVTCSHECNKVLRASYMKGKNNHQFGLKGIKNASFKGIEIKRMNHRLTDTLVYSPTHPFKRSDNRVKIHRLIVEENYKYFNPIYFININGKMYLRPDVDVHHKNGNHYDNSIENLEPLTRSEHTREHNLNKRIIRDRSGQIIGVVKSGNNEESCDANLVINVGSNVSISS